MRIFITISKTINGECHFYFFKRLADANEYAFEIWKEVCEEERLDTYIGVHWIDLTPAFEVPKSDDQFCDKLDCGTDDKCFSSRQIVTSARNAYHEYPSMFFAALDDMVKLISDDTNQILKRECTEAALRLGKVYLKVLDAAGIPLWLIEKN